MQQQCGLPVSRRGAVRATAGWAFWGLALSGVLSVGAAMSHNSGALVLADGSSGPMSSPAYANAFEQWNVYSSRTSSSPVTFRLQAETKFGWEVCVTGGCEALGYWDPDKALLLRTDPSRYPIWEGVGQLPGGCDIEYKYLMRPRGRWVTVCAQAQRARRPACLAALAASRLARPAANWSHASTVVPLVVACMPCAAGLGYWSLKLHASNGPAARSAFAACGPSCTQRCLWPGCLWQGAVVLAAGLRRGTRPTLLPGQGRGGCLGRGQGRGACLGRVRWRLWRRPGQLMTLACP